MYLLLVKQRLFIVIRLYFSRYKIRRNLGVSGNKKITYLTVRQILLSCFTIYLDKQKSEIYLMSLYPTYCKPTIISYFLLDQYLLLLTNK